MYPFASGSSLSETKNTQSASANSASPSSRTAPPKYCDAVRIPANSSAESIVLTTCSYASLGCPPVAGSMKW